MHRTTLFLTILALAACGKEAPAPADRSAESAPPPAPSVSVTPPAPVAAQPAEKPAPARPGEMIPAFRGHVRRGTVSMDFDSRASAMPTVYVVDSATCPACQTYAPRVKELEAAYIAKGVNFVHLYPKLVAGNAKHVAWHDEKGFPGGQMLDPDGSISKSLAATRTPEVIVADSKGTIVYRGAVDDSMDAARVKTRYLAEALDATLSNGKVPHAETPPVG